MFASSAGPDAPGQQSARRRDEQPPFAVHTLDAATASALGIPQDGTPLVGPTAEKRGQRGHVGEGGCRGLVPPRAWACLPATPAHRSVQLPRAG